MHWAIDRRDFLQRSLNIKRCKKKKQRHENDHRPNGGKQKVPNATLGWALHYEATPNVIIKLSEGGGRGGAKGKINWRWGIRHCPGNFRGSEQWRSSWQKQRAKSCANYGQYHSSCTKTPYRISQWSTRYEVAQFFLKRHDNLTLKRRVSLESALTYAINPQIVVIQFARLKYVMEKHDIKDPSQIFNLD